jgi:HlyD family secretion protein
MSPKRKKLLIGVGIAGAIVLFAGLALAGRRERGIEVRTEKVQRRDLVAVVTASGRIRPRRSVDVQADITGRIIELRVEEGDSVQKGDTLLRIDPTTYEAAVQQARAALAQAEANLAQAQANLEQARRGLQRTRELKRENPNLVSDEQVELAETNFEVQRALAEAARYAVEQARARLREATDQLAKTVITAPMTGIVTRVNVEEGETAIVGTMNNPGTILLTVADLSEMEAVVEVDETDVPEIEVGDSVAVQVDAYPNRTFVGRVVSVGHSALQARSPGAFVGSSDQPVDFEVVVALENPPPGLRPDLSATADIVTATRDSVLAIPIIALTLKELEDEGRVPRERAGDTLGLGVRSDRDVEGVYVVRDGKVEFRPVKVGITGQNHFEVVDGLVEGEEIVVGPFQAIRRLRDGAAVKVARARPPREPGASAADTAAGS